MKEVHETSKRHCLVGKKLPRRRWSGVLNFDERPSLMRIEGGSSVPRGDASRMRS